MKQVHRLLLESTKKTGFGHVITGRENGMLLCDESFCLSLTRKLREKGENSMSLQSPVDNAFLHRCEIFQSLGKFL